MDTIKPLYTATATAVGDPVASDQGERENGRGIQT
jgi:hypothetical protein